MSHKHHNCKCDHSNVKFCSSCQLVHCLDCNKEWRYTNGYSYYTYLGNGYGYNNNTISVSSGSLLGGAGGGVASGGGSLPQTTLTTTAQPTLTCDHKA